MSSGMSHEMHAAGGTEICTPFGIKDLAKHSTFFKKCFRCVGCNKTIVFYILFAPKHWDLLCFCWCQIHSVLSKNTVISSGIICITCIKRGPFSPPPGNQFEKNRPPERTDLRQRTAPGWIYAFHFNDRGDGPQKLLSWRVGLRESFKRKNPKPLGILQFCCGGMNLPKLLEFALFCFWRWT